MVIDWRDLPTYDPPKLPSLRTAGAGWIGAMVLQLVPVILVVLTLRGDREVSRAVAVTALVVAAASSATGIWWSAQVTRTIHRLEGRLPSMVSAVRAWLWPLAVFGIGTATVLRLDPSEPVDIRGLVVGTLLAVSVWRPCALLSRTLRSLTRLNHDVLVFGLALAQLTVWGTLWWLIRTSNSSSQGAPTGIALATIAAAAGAVAVAVAIVRATVKAREYRILMLQAATEQRYVRSLGLNPLDRRTFAALVLAKQERERQLMVVIESPDAPADDTEPQDRPAPAGSVSAEARRASPDTPAGHEDPAASSTASPRATVGTEAGRDRPRASSSPVFRLQATRYLLLLALAVTELLYLWIAFRANDLQEPLRLGRLSPADVDRLNDALDWTTAAIAVVIPLQVWWIVAAGTWAARQGVGIPVRRCTAIAAAATALSAGTIVLGLAHGSGTLQGTALIVSSIGAWGALLVAGPLADMIERSRNFVRLWATGQSILAFVHAFFGGFGSVTSSTSVVVLAFTAAMLGLVTAATAVVAGGFSVEVENTLRGSQSAERASREPHDSEEEEEGGAAGG